MAMNQSPNIFYVIGGTLRRDALSYVPRQADEDLYEGLRQDKFCYVLTSRQMGKSSLMVRTAARLRKEGATVAILDLTRIGQNLTPEQWYDGLLGQLGEQLNLTDELESSWLSRDRLGPLDRWMRAVREIVLPRRSGQIVIFVDEIDAVRSLPFSTDEFFAAIRECYNRRTEASDLARLTFCLLGVATPSDLIRDTRTTPFNVGQRIELNDFTEAEAAPLAEGLGRDERTTQKLLSRILYWTGGHPYLTQRLCQAVAEDTAITTLGGVDRLCEELFFTTRARERDDNLLFVRERMLRSEGDLAGLLDLYAQVRRDKRIRDDETNPLVSLLRLSGVTRVFEGLLYVRNRIYYRVFDREWVLANMPDAELRRQRAAYRRGLWRATAIAAVILTVIASLALYTLNARTIAYRSLQQANSSAEEARKALAESKRQSQRAEDQKSEAERQQQIAEEQTVEAEQQRQEAISQRVIADEQRGRAEMALAEAEKQRTIADDQRQQAVEQTKMAEQQRNLVKEEARRAEMALVETEKQRKIADDQRLKVVEQKELAEQKQTEAVEQRHLIEQIKAFLEQTKTTENHLSFVTNKTLFPNEEATLFLFPNKEMALFPNEELVGEEGSMLRGAIWGRVYEYGNREIPIAGAEIILVNLRTGIETTRLTNATGEFFMDYLTPGEYKITARHAGYEQIEASTTNVDIKLQKLTVLKPPPFALRKKTIAK